jgi:hypothetical protein
MNLFKNELFNDTMLQALAREPRSYRTPTFGRRYGRRRDEDEAPVSAPALIACTVECIGDEPVRQYDQAA